MEREQRKELESNDTKRYLFLQAALAILSFVTILVGSLYFEKYQEEWITSLIVTLLLGLVYGNVLKEYLDNWKIILGIHFIMMLLITIGFLFDGFYKPIAFAPIVIGSFLTPEVGLAAAVYYGITAVLYTMETGEILMLYLLVAGVGIYFLRDFFSSNSVGKKIGAILVLFLLQAAGTILFRFYMYREAEWSIAMISGGLLAGVTGVFSFLLPLFASMETITFQKTEKEKKKVENSFGYIDRGDNFLNRIPMAQVLQSTFHKWDLMKLKSFTIGKNITNSTSESGKISKLSLEPRKLHTNLLRSIWVINPNKKMEYRAKQNS